MAHRQQREEHAVPAAYVEQRCASRAGRELRERRRRQAAADEQAFRERQGGEDFEARFHGLGLILARGASILAAGGKGRVPPSAVKRVRPPGAGIRQDPRTCFRSSSPPTTKSAISTFCTCVSRRCWSAPTLRRRFPLGKSCSSTTAAPTAPGRGSRSSARGTH